MRLTFYTAMWGSLRLAPIKLIIMTSHPDYSYQNISCYKPQPPYRQSTYRRLTIMTTCTSSFWWVLCLHSLNIGGNSLLLSPDLRWSNKRYKGVRIVLLRSTISRVVHSSECYACKLCHRWGDLPILNQSERQWEREGSRVRGSERERVSVSSRDWSTVHAYLTNRPKIAATSKSPDLDPWIPWLSWRIPAIVFDLDI